MVKYMKSTWTTDANTHDFITGVSKLYNDFTEKLKAQCTHRNEDNYCDKYPDGCSVCFLVAQKIVTLPKVWQLTDKTVKSNPADVEQNHLLLMKHIRGECEYYCVYCEIEKISPPLPPRPDGSGGRWNDGASCRSARARARARQFYGRKKQDTRGSV